MSIKDFTYVTHTAPLKVHLGHPAPHCKLEDAGLI